jgi:hypothetical protein
VFPDFVALVFPKGLRFVLCCFQHELCESVTRCADDPVSTQTGQLVLKRMEPTHKLQVPTAELQIFSDDPSPPAAEAFGMFSRAAMVVGLHGAGLSNAVMMASCSLPTLGQWLYCVVWLINAVRRVPCAVCRVPDARCQMPFVYTSHWNEVSVVTAKRDLVGCAGTCRLKAAISLKCSSQNPMQGLSTIPRPNQPSPTSLTGSLNRAAATTGGFVFGCLSGSKCGSFKGDGPTRVREDAVGTGQQVWFV